MESALQKLLGSGLARKTEDGFAITGSGKSVRKSAPRGSIYERMKWMQNHLQDRVPCSPTTDWTLPAREYESALAEYRSRMRALTDKKM